MLVLFKAMDPVRFDVGYENINIVQQYWVLSSFGNCHSSYIILATRKQMYNSFYEDS